MKTSTRDVPPHQSGSDHWRAGCLEIGPVRFGKGPSEKDPSHGHLVGGLLHSASGTEKRAGGNTGTALRADSTVAPVRLPGASSGTHQRSVDQHELTTRSGDPRQHPVQARGANSPITSRAQRRTVEAETPSARSARRWSCRRHASTTTACRPGSSLRQREPIALSGPRSGRRPCRSSCWTAGGATW